MKQGQVDFEKLPPPDISPEAAYVVLRRYMAANRSRWVDVETAAWKIFQGHNCNVPARVKELYDLAANPRENLLDYFLGEN